MTLYFFAHVHYLNPTAYKLWEVEFEERGTQLFFPRNHPANPFVGYRTRHYLPDLERQGWRKTPQEAKEAALQHATRKAEDAFQACQKAATELEQIKQAVQEAAQ